MVTFLANRTPYVSSSSSSSRMFGDKSGTRDTRLEGNDRGVVLERRARVQRHNKAETRTVLLSPLRC